MAAGYDQWISVCVWSRLGLMHYLENGNFSFSACFSLRYHPLLYLIPWF